MMRNCLLRSFLTLVLVVVAMMIQPSTAAAWFGQSREDSVTTFKRDAARAWQSGKVVGKEKLDQAKEQAKKTLDKASVEAKKKGRKVAKEGRGLGKDVQKRVGRIVMDK